MPISFERYRALHPELSQVEAAREYNNRYIYKINDSTEPAKRGSLDIIRSRIGKHETLFRKSTLAIMMIILVIGIAVSVALGVTMNWGIGAGVIVGSCALTLMSGMIVRANRRSKLEKLIFEEAGITVYECRDHYKDRCLGYVEPAMKKVLT